MTNKFIETGNYQPEYGDVCLNCMKGQYTYNFDSKLECPNCKYKPIQNKIPIYINVEFLNDYA